MSDIFKRLSLMPAGLRHKLMVIFCLMSVIPLMVSVYIVSNFVFPYIKEIGSLSLVLVITICITLLGFILAKQMVEPIINMAVEAKLIANGDLERSVSVDREDEIGDLGMSLNIMTQRIKENIDELKSYGEKTNEINIEIHKKVIALSGLLQVGDLISVGTDLKTTLDILAEKVALVDGNNPAVIMLVDRDSDNMVPMAAINFGHTEAATTPAGLRYGIFAKLRGDLKDILIDKNSSKEDKVVKSFRELYKLTNGIILPITTRGKLEGAIITGNDLEGFEYKTDEVELFHVFCKQAAIAIENDTLFKKAEELEVKDDLTGLYNNKYIREHLDEEIKRAIIYQRPCSFILFSIDNFKEFCEIKGRVAGEAALKKIARLIAQELTPIDKGARFSDDGFAIVLPERNKREAEEIGNEIRRKISELVIIPNAEDKYKCITVSGGLGENPIDGISVKELVEKAEALVKEAKAAGQNIIKV